MTEKSALDALNEALGAESSGVPDDNAGAQDNDDTTNSATGTGSDASDDSTGTDAVGSSETDGAGDDEDADTDTDAEDGVDRETKPVKGAGDGTLTTAAVDDKRNPDGTFKKKQDEPKKADPVNDPIPKDLKRETHDRMKSLIDTTKTVTQERDQIRQDFDYMVKGVQATGATPEQYGEALSWLALFNSGDMRQQEKALELVESVAERLSTLLGKDRVIGDPLAQHADLKAAVTSKQITPEYAKEIARTRNGQTFRTEIQTAHNQTQQQQQNAEREMSQARSDLSALEENLRAVDGKEYEAIKAQIVGPLKPLMAAISPAQWKTKFTEAYKAAKDARAASRTSVSSIPKNQPLRGGKNPAGGQAKQPASALEALSGALAGMK